MLHGQVFVMRCQIQFVLRFVFCIIFAYAKPKGDSTVSRLDKSKISSLYPSSVTVQAGLCRTCSETTLLVFPRGGSILLLLGHK